MASRADLTLSVRFNSSIPRHVRVDHSWTVRRFMEEIAKVHNVPVEDIKIVFQGKQIEENTLIEDLDLGNFSVLDAVKHRGIHSNHPTLEAVTTGNAPRFVSGVGSVCLSRRERATPAPEGSTAAGGFRKRFYVYCKSRCKDIKPAKLRVRCAKCKMGTLTTEQDPNGWEDVLQRNKIHGECQLEDCDGEWAHFYFKCAAHDTAEDEVSAVLPNVKTNTGEIPCIICQEAFDAQLVYNCEFHHTICLGCFHQYCVTKLSERQFVYTEEHGYNLPCPGSDSGCNTAFLEDPHYFRIMGKEEFDRFQIFATEAMLTQTQGGLICPGVNCGAGIFYEGTDNRVFCIPGCGLEFCRLCKGPYHPGDCAVSREAELRSLAAGGAGVDPAAASRARWMLADFERIREISKPCPSCQIPIEKNAGCMHMTCPNCQHQFCWMCMTPWGRDCQEEHWFA